MRPDYDEEGPPRRAPRFSKTTRRIAAYSLALLLVVVATAVTKRLEPVMGESISPIFFAAVMLSAWCGGFGPGLLATGLSGWATAYFFPNNPPGSGLFSWDDSIRLGVFLMVALLISFLTSLRQKAQEALRRSHLELERRVAQRTGDLTAVNERLRESEDRFRALVDGVSDYAIVMLDAAGRVMSWNGGAGRIEGYDQAEVVGEPASRFFLPENVAHGDPARHLEIAARRGRHEDEGWRIRKDGSRFMANVITTALRSDDGRLRGFAQVTRDVTELRNLEHVVLEISEAERRRVGHDLHDGLGQQLTGLALLTQGLATRLAERSAPEVAGANRILDEINAAIGQARDLARGLSPVELGPDGLRAALLNLATQFESTGGVSCRLVCDPEVCVDDATALHLYRITQEALSNSIRHGRAATIVIALRSTPTGVTLRIEDDGVGIQDDEAQRSGMGIRVMKYRARVIGGSLEVVRREPVGTLVSCECPRGGLGASVEGEVRAAHI